MEVGEDAGDLFFFFIRPIFIAPSSVIKTHYFVCSLWSWTTVNVVDTFLFTLLQERTDQNVTKRGLCNKACYNKSDRVFDCVWRWWAGESDRLVRRLLKRHPPPLTPNALPSDVLLRTVTLRQTVVCAHGWAAGRWGRFWELRCSRCRTRAHTGKPVWCGCRCRWGRWFSPPSAGSETAAAPAGCVALSSRYQDCNPLLFDLMKRRVLIC